MTIKEVKNIVKIHSNAWDSSKLLGELETVENKIKKVKELDQVVVSKISGFYDEFDVPLGIEMSELVKKYILKKLKAKKKQIEKNILDKWEGVVLSGS